jgi:hypothetical protein
MNRPTPETDAAQHEGLLRGNPMPTRVVHVNFARRLECERDEARQSATELAKIAFKRLSFLLATTPIKPSETHEKETEKFIDVLKSWRNQNE